MIRKVEFPFQKGQYKSLIAKHGVEKLLAGSYLLGLICHQRNLCLDYATLMDMDEQKETLPE